MQNYDNLWIIKQTTPTLILIYGASEKVIFSSLG